MNSRSGTDADLTRLRRQQRVLAELGQRAIETDDLDLLMSDASVGVADALQADYSTVFEVRPNDEACQLRHGVGWSDEQVGGANASTNPGSQVGHALCERIVERYGGDIWVESESGGGATFYVTLSAADRGA